MTAQVNAAEHREPLVRIAKRTDISRGKSWAIRAAAIVLALLLGALIMLLLGHNPIMVYADMVRGSLGTQTGRRETVKIAVPLLGAAVAIAPAFLMKFWNIGAEGQILAGGIAATYFALFWADSLPRVPLLIVMFLAAALAGALWGLIPAFFKAKWGTNETLFTLMLNYIALGIEQYLQNGPWKDTKGTGFPIIAQFATNARLPKVLGVHAGWIIVLIFVVLMFLYLRYTKQGYEIAVVGDSMGTAHYAGMKVNTIVLRTVFLSACLIGLAAACKVGTAGILSTSFTDDVGWTGIIVAWLAKLSTGGIFVVSALIGVLQYGSTAAAATFAAVDSSFADMLQGVILFLVLAADFFTRFRVVIAKKEVERHG